MARSSHHVYILRCADDSFYVGLTADLDLRLAEHRLGLDPTSYTYRRRPVELVWSQGFSDRNDAFAVERQIKGWSRSKKVALIGGGVDSVHVMARRERRKREGMQGGSR